MAASKQASKHTHAHVQCSHASAGLAQARPNELILTKNCIGVGVAKVPFLLYAFTYNKIQAKFAAIFPKVYRLSGSVLASYSSPFEKSEKRAWYPLFVHALN